MKGFDVLAYDNLCRMVWFLVDPHLLLASGQFTGVPFIGLLQLLPYYKDISMRC